MALNEGPFHSHDFTKLSVRDAYRILVASIVPRPIAFVSTVDENGVTNLAPFSFFNGVSSNPTCIVFSCSRMPDGSKKDTLRNIEATGEFVVNTSEEAIAEEVNAASAAYPHGVSEFAIVGLTPLASTWVRPPRVAESAIHMECRLEKIVEIGEDSPGGSSLIIGRVLGMHVADRVLAEGEIRYEKLKPVARLGRDEWLRGGEVFRLRRPQIAAHDLPADRPSEKK
ncbi:MAG: flavin reductase family protein [Bdellovibrionales bacterium]|nr:flavin reductase family protein [Bdellovibrionales bacterium]